MSESAPALLGDVVDKWCAVQGIIDDNAIWRLKQQLARALDSIPEARSDGWQPIETAPKDGTWFLAHGDGPDVIKCQFVCAWDFDDAGKTDWREIYTEMTMRPTRWQPLPSPPLPPDAGQLEPTK